MGRGCRRGRRRRQIEEGDREEEEGVLEEVLYDEEESWHNV